MAVAFRVSRNLRPTILLPVLFAAACGGGDGAPKPSRSGTVPTVEVTQARFGALPLEERLSGVVRARNQTDITPEISGVVMEVLVADGQFVERGQVLVRLRDTEYRERFQQARAGFDIAKAQTQQAQTLLNQRRSQLARSQALAAQNLESVADREALEALVEQSEAGLALALAQESQAESVLRERETALSNTVVKAPISGTIGQRSAEVGQMVGPGQRLFIIGDLGRMHVDLMLNEPMLNRIRIGMTVILSSPSFPDTTIRAQLNRISPFLNPQSYSTTAEVDVPNAGRLLRPGMFVSVDILYGQTETATLVPNSALFKHPRQGSEGVFLAPAMAKEITFEDGPGTRSPELYGPTGVEFRSVRVIARGREVSAVAGLAKDDWVVTLGHQMLVQNVAEARVRMVEWPHILELQRLQTRDLTRKVTAKTDS